MFSLKKKKILRHDILAHNIPASRYPSPKLCAQRGDGLQRAQSTQTLFALSPECTKSCVHTKDRFSPFMSNGATGFPMGSNLASHLGALKNWAHPSAFTYVFYFTDFPLFCLPRPSQIALLHNCSVITLAFFDFHEIATSICLPLSHFWSHFY